MTITFPDPSLSLSLSVCDVECVCGRPLPNGDCSASKQTAPRSPSLSHSPLQSGSSLPLSLGVPFLTCGVCLPLAWRPPSKRRSAKAMDGAAVRMRSADPLQGRLGDEILTLDDLLEVRGSSNRHKQKQGFAFAIASKARYKQGCQVRRTRKSPRASPKSPKNVLYYISQALKIAKNPNFWLLMHFY